jgi:hypothetical protein
MNPIRMNRRGRKHRPTGALRGRLHRAENTVDTDPARTQADALIVIARPLDAIEAALNAIRDELRETGTLTHPTQMKLTQHDQPA